MAHETHSILVISPANDVKNNLASKHDVHVGKKQSQWILLFFDFPCNKYSTFSTVQILRYCVYMEALSGPTNCTDYPHFSPNFTQSNLSTVQWHNGTRLVIPLAKKPLWFQSTVVPV